MKEEAHIDFKETIDIRKDSDFAKVAKHIFAFSNRGGGWLLFGIKENEKKQLIPVGITDNFNLDQATIQEKFNGYSSEPIEIGYDVFSKIVALDGIEQEKEFVVLYIPPSKSILKPVKDGIYSLPDGKRKTAFLKDAVLTRRGTQSVVATEKEEEDIRQRIEKHLQHLSFLSGTPDQTKETIYSNFLRVLELPRVVYEINLLDEEIPLSRTGRYPFLKRLSKLYSFCSLNDEPFSEYVDTGSQGMLKVSELLQTPAGQNLVTALLNIEASASMKQIGLSIDHESYDKSYFYAISGKERKEDWEIFGRKKTRTVSKRFYHDKIKAFRWWHYSVSLRFFWIENQCYLRLLPGMLLTENGIYPIHNEVETTKITSFLSRRYNAHFRNDVFFWLSKLPRNELAAISFGNRIEISPELIRSYTSRGISGDVLVREQKEGPYKYNDYSDGNALRGDFLEEPLLVFGQQMEEQDPRMGLKFHGPYHAHDEKPMPQFNLGIISTGEGRDLALDLLDQLRKSKRSPEANRFLRPDYPGFSENTSVKCRIEESKSWGATVTQSEIESIMNIQDSNERIRRGMEIYSTKVEAISREDSRPDVLLCLLPKIIVDYCGISDRTKGAKRPKYTKKEKEFAEAQEDGQTTLVDFGLADKTLKSFDFHDALKGEVMKHGIPIQVLHEESARALLNYTKKSGIQDPATFCWNLSTALYYKSNGKPWRIAKLEHNTCYVGVSFYRRRDDPLGKTRVSMAQVFTHSGEGFVLRGEKVELDEFTKQPYLTFEAAKDLLYRAIKVYSQQAISSPARVVIHKTSKFTLDERRGFLDAVGNAKTDMVTIRGNHDIRFFRTGRYPVLRGTMIKLSNRECLLYTAGYIPRLRTYDGPRIPKPVLLELDCDSDMQFVASEVLNLTKIDWNNTEFANKYPITTVFPRRVGNVLSEIPEDEEVKGHYKFYM
jgi:hypothetical protein